MLTSCIESNYDEAYQVIAHLWKMGYSAVDIISNIFRVCKNLEMAEYLKLEFIKVRSLLKLNINKNCLSFTIMCTNVKCISMICDCFMS